MSGNGNGDGKDVASTPIRIIVADDHPRSWTP